MTIENISTEELLKLYDPNQAAMEPPSGIQDVPTGQLLAQTEDYPKELIGKLGGYLPVSSEKIRAGKQLTAREHFILSRPSGERAQREGAFKELTEMGYTAPQLQTSMDIQKGLNKAKIGRPAGGIGGALAATAVAGRFIPGPIDDAAIIAALVAAGGAGVGGMAGEAAQTAIDERRLVSKGEALSAFATEAATELGGRAIASTGKFILSPFIKKTVPEAAGLIDDYAKVGGHFSPTELDRRFSLRIQESFSRGSFGAQEIFQEFEEKQGKASLTFAKNIIDSIAKGVARETPEQIGETFAEGITRPGGRIFNILDDLVNPLYTQIDELGKGAKVSTKTLKQFAKKHLATDGRLKGQFLSPSGKNKLSSLLELDDSLSFSDMRTLRSSFLKDIQKMARDVDQSQGIIKQLAGITDQAIFDPKAARGLDSKALNLLRNTNALYKSAQQGIKTTFPESLAKRLLKNPSSVVKQVFPNNNPHAIRMLRESLVEPVSGKPSVKGKALWNQLRQSWLSEAVDQSTKDGIVKPKVFNNLLTKLTDDGFSEMFPEKEVAKNVKRIPALFSTAGRTPPTGAALFSRGAQVTGVAIMYGSAKEGNLVGVTAGGVLVFGPLAFAKLATHPRGVKFLTSGMNLKPGAKALVPNAVRMIKVLKEIDRKNIKAQFAGEQKPSYKKGKHGLPLMSGTP